MSCLLCSPCLHPPTHQAMATCEPGAAERVLRLVRAKMARFQEGQAGSRAGSRNGMGSGATSDPTAATSVSGFPMQQLHQIVAGSTDGAMVDATMGLRIGGTSPASGSSGSRVAAGGGGSMDAALRTALADREQQLAELRETNEARQGSGGGGRLAGCASLCSKCRCNLVMVLNHLNPTFTR